MYNKILILLIMNFRILKTYKNARLGLLESKNGSIETPAFIFCATKGTIKCISDIDAQVILSNTYHLMNYPGEDHIYKMGGLHKFMSWDKPLFTDSGGFQIFSLGYGSVSDEIKSRGRKMSNNVRITEEGAIFKSYINGREEILTPERSILIQKKIGSNFLMPLDECTAYNIGKEKTELSMLRSHRWEIRSLEEFNREKYHGSLYGIIQGGIYKDLREESIKFCEENNFFGTAIGGSLGSNKEEMYDTVSYTMNCVKKKERPVHLLGIGGLRDIYNGVMNGIDTFDCVHPTRIARHGSVLTMNGKTNLLNSKHKESNDPICEYCSCIVCKKYSRGYIHYLFKAKEMLGMILATKHNMHYMNNYMEEIRKGINNGDIEDRIGKILLNCLE